MKLTYEYILENRTKEGFGFNESFKDAGVKYIEFFWGDYNYDFIIIANGDVVDYISEKEYINERRNHIYSDVIECACAYKECFK